MAESKLNGTRFDIGSITVKGAPAGTSAARLDRAIRQGLAGVLGDSESFGNERFSSDIPRLRLQLTPGATEAQIAEALVLAISRASRGERA